jgi:hypothetical protein
MNNSGDLVFIGDLTAAPASEQTLGVFFFDSRRGQTSAVACPSDKLPGGGAFVTAGLLPYQYYLNNSGDISFIARLDTDTNQGWHR